MRAGQAPAPRAGTRGPGGRTAGRLLREKKELSVHDGHREGYRITPSAGRAHLCDLIYIKLWKMQSTVCQRAEEWGTGGQEGGTTGQEETSGVDEYVHYCERFTGIAIC